MHSPFLVPAAIVWAVTALPLAAQVPHLLNYQGRVKVSGADFTGTGQFKFALVSGAGSTTYWSNDGTSASGSQPAASVSLNVSGGLYSVLLGDATLPNMTSVTPGVFGNSDVRLRVWFSDGVNGWQQLTPDQRVAAVGYALMADDVKDGAVTSAKLADGAVTSTKLAAGAVTSTALSPTAVSDSLAATGQGTVPSGATLLSPVQNAPSLLAAGYVSAGMLNGGDSWTAIQGGTARDTAASVWTGTEMLIWGDGAEGWRYNPTTNVWRAMSTTGQPTQAAREDASAVWTGTEMIVWGGAVGTAYTTTGGRYNPVTDTWSIMTPTNMPAGRVQHTVVWTGSEMVVWGGYANGALANGARYNPSLGGGGTWTALPASGLEARYWHTAVWSGTEMIIYGGLTGSAGLNNGARFNPAGSGTWTAIPAGPSSRFFHTAVWTGSGMLVWGGSNNGTTTPSANGSIYRPASNDWTPVATAGGPQGRWRHKAVWTGTEMIVWGGSTSNVDTYVYTATGSRYNPVNSTWTALTTGGSPAARMLPNLIWTGTEMIVGGGSNGSGFSEGGRYRSGQTFYLYQRP